MYYQPIKWNCRKCMAIIHRTIEVKSYNDAMKQALEMKATVDCDVCNGSDSLQAIADRRMIVATANQQFRPVNMKPKGIITTELENGRIKQEWTKRIGHAERALIDCDPDKNTVSTSARKLKGTAWTWSLLETGRRGQDETVW